jgi:hypothetical protein
MNAPDTDWAWPWWSAMVIINIFNLALCVWCYRKSANAPDGQSSYLNRMRIMGLIFTLVALYRAIFVSRYLYQYAWFDTIANSSLLIRCFAWAAELSFAGLIAMAMLRFNNDTRDPGSSQNSLATFYINKAPLALFACIFLAQFFATGGLITKSRLLFAIEETLWGLGFLAILPLAVIQFRQRFSQSAAASLPSMSMLNRFATINLGWCAIYCTYSLAYHLPTEYWASAFEQLATGIPEMKTGLSAVTDAFTTVNVTHTYSDWGFGFVLWHSSYFSVCVWLAIFLMRGPRKLAVPNSAS